MADASFEILIDAQANGVDVAAAKVAELSDKILASDKAAKDASNAVAEAAAAYTRLEGVYIGLLKESDKLAQAQDLLGSKLARAQKAGDDTAIKKLTAAMADLADKQALVANRTERVKAAMAAKAETADNARRAVESVAEAQEATAKSAEHLGTATGNAAKLLKGLAKYNPNELAEGFGKIGGPLGRAAQLLTEQVVLYKKISTGSAGAFGAGTILALKMGNALIFASTAAAGLAAGLLGVAAGFAGSEEERAAFTAGIAKAKAGFKALFQGISLAPVLSAFERVVGLLDAGSASGRALKAILETLLVPIIGSFEDFGVAVERAFLMAEISLLEFMLQWKKGQGGLAGDVKATVEVLKGLWEATKILFDGILFAGNIVAMVIATVAAGFAFVVAGVLAGLAVVTGAITAFVGVLTGDFDLFDLGVNMTTGLVAGITSAAGQVLESLHSVVSGAVDGAKKFLGIASPSKLLAEMGGYTAEGFTVGVEQKAPEAATALEAMVTPPPPSNASPGAAANGAQGAGGSSSSANLSGTTFNFYGVQGAEDARAKFEETLLKVLDGAHAQLGGAGA